MKKNLLFSLFISFFFGSTLLAQTTGTFIVADKGNRMASCADTLLTINDIYEQLAIRDLNDANEDVTNYRLLQLNGSVITENEVTGSFKFSDYQTIYIEKKNSTGTTGHEGLQIFIDVITPPTRLFKVDTLKYTVDKGAKVNIAQDVFSDATLNLWSSGKDVLPLQDRMLFRDYSSLDEQPLSQVPNWAQVGPGFYRITLSVSVCTETDIYTDILFIKVTESLCNSIQVKNAPSICTNAIIDITPYVYVNDHVATVTELADMTFYDKSDITNQTGGAAIDPKAINTSNMFNTTNLYPKFEIVYQPNVTVGTCYQYQYQLDFKIPKKFVVTDVILPVDNYGRRTNYTIDGDYYGFNNIFHKNVLQQLYLDNYNVFSGTTFKYFTDNSYVNEVTGLDLSPGEYYVAATNPACLYDSSFFKINVKNRDYEIKWQYAPNIGKGYYTFTAPVYPGAKYAWMVWGGSIVAGLNTNQVTVYYSETASPAVAISCDITLAPAKTTSGNGVLSSRVYLTTDEDGAKIEIPKETVTTDIPEVISTNYATAYPNPTDGTFSISGEGAFGMKIYNSMGQLVHEENNYIPNTSITVRSKGMHVVHLNQNGKTQIVKVILK